MSYKKVHTDSFIHNWMHILDYAKMPASVIDTCNNIWIIELYMTCDI